MPLASWCQIGGGVLTGPRSRFCVLKMVSPSLGPPGEMASKVRPALRSLR